MLPKYKRVLLKLSGESLMGDKSFGLDPLVLRQYAKDIKEIVDESVKNWGVHIISLQIKDIKIPINIMTSLSSAVTAERDAQAKIITAKANVEAAQLMRQAADILDTPAAMQTRSLEVIDRLAHSQNAKVIILPSDLNLNANIRSNVVLNDI